MCAPAMASSLHLQMQPSRLVAVLGEASLQVPCHSVAPQDSVQVNIAIRLALLGETQAQAARSAGLQVNRVSSRVDRVWGAMQRHSPLGPIAGRSLLLERSLQFSSKVCVLERPWIPTVSAGGKCCRRTSQQAAH